MLGLNVNSVNLVLVNALLLSLLAHVYQFRKIQKFKKAPPTYDARRLLHDLTVGSAAVKIERLDPNEFYLRSPRDL